MPHDAPAIKVDATAAWGAEIVRYDRYEESREATAEAAQERTGGTVIPPYDHPAVMAGQGTVALEFLEQVPRLDLLVVPVGGGGLIAGCATIARHVHPSITIVGVEPAAAGLERQGFGWDNKCGTGKGADTITSGLEGAWSANPIAWSNQYLDNLFG